MQFFRARCIYWQEVQTAKEDKDMNFREKEVPGDVDDLIFQDCWLASDR